MSWAITKKSINSDLGTPLNELIENKTDTISGNIISPTKPSFSALSQDTTSQNTWYTVVNVVSGKGILSHCALATQLDGNQNAEIRITVDSVVHVISPSASNWSSAIFRDSGNGRPDKSIDYFAHCFFKESMKVEIRHVQASHTGRIQATVYYSLV